MFNPFQVETRVEYRSPISFAEFQSETGPLFASALPNDCIVDLVDESGRTTQKLYGAMAFVALPQASARVQIRATDGGTILSVAYVMPLLLVLFHRSFQFFCVLGGLVLVLSWLWVIRYGWSNVRPDLRATLIMGSIVFVGFTFGAITQLPLSHYPSPLSVWLENVGDLKKGA